MMPYCYPISSGISTGVMCALKVRGSDFRAEGNALVGQQRGKLLESQARVARHQGIVHALPKPNLHSPEPLPNSDVG